MPVYPRVFDAATVEQLHAALNPDGPDGKALTSKAMGFVVSMNLDGPTDYNGTRTCQRGPKGSS